MPDPPAATADRLPTFFVIGAANAGTTSLHHYLDAHPEIEMTNPKEPHLLCGPPDFRDRLWAYDVYLRGTAPLRGEVSPGYATHPLQPGIADRIAAIAPDAPLVYLVRDPIERAVAQYAEHAIQGIERRSLDQALDPSDPRSPYVVASRYATQVEEYLRRFDAERLLIADSVDLRDRRRETLARIFGHVGADPGYWDPSFDRGVRPRGRPVSPAAGTELRSRLAEVLAPEAARLRELTGRPFASWSV